MSKFKVGDKVRYFGETYIVAGDNGKGMVSLKDISTGDINHIVPEDNLTLANSRTCNSTNLVVRNAMKAVVMNAEQDGKCRVTLKIPFGLKVKMQSDTMNYQQFIKWATENGISKDTAASMWEKANKSGGVIGGYVTASCPFSLVEV